MPLTPHAGEPPAGPWRVIALRELVAALLEAAGPVDGRVRVIAVDGRSGAGKTTLAARIAAAVRPSAVVHTDDIAWFHSRFGWSELMVDGVLGPVRRGGAVAYRPPPWDERSRPGAIVVPTPLELLMIEGVGAGRADLASLTDAMVWVQSDADDARRRGIARDGGGEEARRHWDEWAAEEEPFLACDRPWERADVIVAGSPVRSHDPDTEVVVAPPP